MADTFATRPSPIPPAVAATAAERHGLAPEVVADALASVHEGCFDGADVRLAQAESLTVRPDPVVVADGLAAVQVVPAGTWGRLADRLGFSDDVRAAAMDAHADFARATADVETPPDRHPLVLPSGGVTALVRAGLSPRQAEVQVLREAGFTQDEVADRLGLTVGTVKSHSHRVAAKVADARRLVDLVDA